MKKFLIGLFAFLFAVVTAVAGVGIASFYDETVLINARKVFKVEQNVNETSSSNDEKEYLEEELKSALEQLDAEKQKNKEFEKISPIFSENSFEKIAKVSDEISAKNMTTEQIKENYGWDIGDQKTIKIDNIQYEFIILGFNHDEKSDGSGKAGITLGMKSIIDFSDGFVFSNSNSNPYWGQNDCTIWKETLNTYFEKLPSDLQGKIKSVKKKTIVFNWDYPDDHLDLIETDDRLWLLSPSEIYSETSLESCDVISKKDLMKQEGNQYEYFLNLIGDVYNPSQYNKNLSIPGGSKFHSYWLRSSCGHKFIFSIDKNGVLSTSNYDDLYNLRFCFCI